MNKTNVKAAIEEAEVFILRAVAVVDEMQDAGTDCTFTGTAKSGALRRQSLELTRALARMRKP